MGERTDIFDKIEATIYQSTLERVGEAQEALPAWTVSAVADGDSLWWEATREGQRIRRARLDSLVFIAELIEGKGC